MRVAVLGTGIMGALAARLPAGAVWAQTSTVGLAATERLVALGATPAFAIVDAPVLGTRAPAEQGELARSSRSSTASRSARPTRR